MAAIGSLVVQNSISVKQIIFAQLLEDRIFVPHLLVGSAPEGGQQRTRHIVLNLDSAIEGSVTVLGLAVPLCPLQQQVICGAGVSV